MLILHAQAEGSLTLRNVIAFEHRGFPTVTSTVA